MCIHVYIGMDKAHITCSTIVIAEFVFDALRNDLQVHLYNSQDSM